MAIVKGNIIDVVRVAEGFSVYVRYVLYGQVYLSSVLNIWNRPYFFLEQEVMLEVSELGVKVI